MAKYQINYEAIDADENKKNGIPYADLIILSETITGILLILVLVLTFVFRVAAVGGDSMSPTISDGDKIVIKRLNYVPAKGDIVSVDKEGLGKSKLRRIIAEGGDKVTVSYTTGKVTVNGTELEERYMAYTEPDILGEDFTIEVPGGHYFVLGDNRNNSYDSRSSGVGCITADDIEGKAVVRIWPMTKLGSLE